MRFSTIFISSTLIHTHTNICTHVKRKKVYSIFFFFVIFSYFVQHFAKVNKFIAFAMFRGVGDNAAGVT